MPTARMLVEGLRSFRWFEYLAVVLVLLGLCCGMDRGKGLESGPFSFALLLAVLLAVVPPFPLWWLVGLGWLCRAARSFELWSCWWLTPALALAFFGVILPWLWRLSGF
jgi:hypothetical protein